MFFTLVAVEGATVFVLTVLVVPTNSFSMIRLIASKSRRFRHLLNEQSNCNNSLVRFRSYCGSVQLPVPTVNRRHHLLMNAAIDLTVKKNQHVKRQPFSSTTTIDNKEVDSQIVTTSTLATESNYHESQSHDHDNKYSPPQSDHPSNIAGQIVAAISSDHVEHKMSISFDSGFEDMTTGDDLENDDHIDFDGDDEVESDIDDDEVESDSDDDYEETDGPSVSNTNGTTVLTEQEQLIQQVRSKEKVRISKEGESKRKKRNDYFREIERQLPSKSRNAVDIALYYCDESKFPIGSFYRSMYLMSHVKHSKNYQSYSDKSFAERPQRGSTLNYNIKLGQYNNPSETNENDVVVPVIQHVYRTMHKLKQQKDGDKELELKCQVVNACFSLLDRIVREEAAMNIMYHNRKTQLKYIREQTIHGDSKIDTQNNDIPSLNEVRLNQYSGNVISPRSICAIVKKWKDAILHQFKFQSSFWRRETSPLAYPKVMSAKELLQYIQELTTTLLSTTRNNNRFPKNVSLYDTVTMNMIMEVIIKQHPDLTTAPYVAQSIFDFILENGKNQSKEYGESYNEEDDDSDNHDLDQSNPMDKRPTHSSITASVKKTKTYEFQIKPNIFTYGLLLSAWAHSGLPSAGVKMEEIIDEMHRDNSAPKPTSATYGTLLRYYSQRGDIAHVHRILQRMSLENLQPNVDSYANVLYCCCKNQQISKAAFIMNQILMEVDQDEVKRQNYVIDLEVPQNETSMMNSSDSNTSDRPSSISDDQHNYKVLQESIFNMLVAYRDAVASPSSSRELINQYIVDAEQLVARLQKNCFLLRMRNKSNDSGSKVENVFDRISNLLMIIYARANRIHDAELLFAKASSSNDLRYYSLIKAYTKLNLPERATALLHRMMKDKNVVSMDSRCFAAVVDGWADAAERNNGDALRNAIQIVQLMDTDERCRQFNVRPSVLVFNGVIKCLSNIKKQSILANPSCDPDSVVAASGIAFDPCQTAIEILNEMEERGKTYGSAAPNHISYSLVVKTCFKNNKLELADEILRRMEDSNTPPDIRTYADILLHYSTLGTEAGAKQTENVFEYVKYLSMTKPLLKPDIVCYTILLHAWVEAKPVDSTDHAWRIYQMAQKDGLEMDSIFASRVISVLSSYDVNCPSYCSQHKEQQLDAFEEPIGLESSPSIPSSTPLNLRRAVLVLDEMNRATFMAKKPNSHLYKLVIKGFLSIGDVVTATSLLLRMIESYMDDSNTHAKPNAFLMSNVVMAWISYGDLIKATLLLNKLAELFCKKHIPVGPDMGTYRTLIAHWNRSLHPNKEFYLTQLKSHMAAIDPATNPSSAIASLTGNTDAEISMINASSPQTFLATALAALKRQS